MLKKGKKRKLDEMIEESKPVVLLEHTTSEFLLTTFIFSVQTSVSKLIRPQYPYVTQVQYSTC